MARKKGQGRKLFDGKDYNTVIAKLEQVWSLDGSDSEAAFNADITPTALSRFLSSHPLISQRKDALRNKPVLKARISVINGLDDPDFALKYLERKKSKEFALTQILEHSGKGGEPINLRFTPAKAESKKPNE